MTPLSTRTLDQIRDHADSEPYEAVGVVHPDGTTTRLVNQAKSTLRFLVNPTQLKERLVEKLERGEDADIWAIYHSHILPNSTTDPSVYDITFMGEVEQSLPGVRHIIITESAVDVWKLNHGLPQKVTNA